MQPVLRVLIVIFALAISWRLFVSLGSREMAADLAVYEVASERLYAGQDIYLHDYNHDVADKIYKGTPPAAVWFQLHYLYPPFFAAALKPLIPATHEETKFFFDVFNYFLLVFSGVFLTKITAHSIVGQVHYLYRFTTIFFLMVAYDSFYINFAEGQVNIIVLALILGFLELWLQKRDIFSGALLSSAMLLKMSPVLLIAAPIRSKQHKVTMGFLLTAIIAIGALYFAPIPQSGYMNFLHQFWNLTGGSMEEGLLNISLQKIILTLFGMKSSSIGRIAFKVGILSVSGFVIAKMNPKSVKYPIYATSILILGMIAVSPITWSHHLVLLFLPFAALLVKDSGSTVANNRRLTIFFGFVLFFSKIYLFQMYVLHEYPVLLPWYYTFINCGLITLAIILYTDSRVAEQSV